MKSERENFLARWSRLKREEVQPENPPVAPRPQADPQAPPPELPPIEELTIDSDFSGFFHPKVDENLRRSALKKLFGDPHFNVMDGLDTYIDDYSKSDPLPAEMLAKLRHAQQIFTWAAESKDECAGETAVRPAEVPAPAAPVAAIESQIPPVNIAVQPVAGAQASPSRLEIPAATEAGS